MAGKQKPPTYLGGSAVGSPATSNTDALSSVGSCTSYPKDEPSSFDFGSDLTEDAHPELWRKKSRQAFVLLRKFFCNSPELHDHGRLAACSNHEERKTNLFAQFGKSCASDKASTIAQAALQV